MRRASGAVLVAAALAACRGAPDDLTLLFYERGPVARAGDLAWAPDPAASRLVAFDRRLKPVRTIGGPRIAQPVAVAALPGGRLLVTERSGEGLVLDTTGAVVREWDSPHPVSVYATGGGGGDRIVAARSPYRVPQFLTERAGAPLLAVLDTLGQTVSVAGAIDPPALPVLTQVANAGAVAVGDDGAVYFAALARDVVRRYGPDGALAWSVSLRGGDAPVASDAVGVPHRVVNIALAVGPFGWLYVLGAADSAGRRLRVDVLDAATGTVIAGRALDSTETALAVDARGRLRGFDAARLAAALAPAEREAFAPPFALPDLSGDTVRLADYRGKVTLVNFWASWCDPCRDEFPHMARLYRGFPRAAFAIAAISDDVDRREMREFAALFQPPFPVLVGGGRMKQVYRYRGLPYSVLLDRRGRIVERIFGFGGAAEFARLRAAIAKEVAVP